MRVNFRFHIALELPSQQLYLTATSALFAFSTAYAQPSPPYVAPTIQVEASNYIDDTRGVYVPAHRQPRLKTPNELHEMQTVVKNNDLPSYMAGRPGQTAFEHKVNQVSIGVDDPSMEMERIAKDPGILSSSAPVGMENMGERRIAAKELTDYPSLATTGSKKIEENFITAPIYGASRNNGQQIAGNKASSASIDMQNGRVKLAEDRIAIRRALQRMMDQIGGGNWTLVWDLEEQNAGLPDMEVSLHAEEPFINVLNALLARLQTRSGQPLRVIRYDNTERLVITDRQGDGPRTGGGISTIDSTGREVAVTETVLKESVVSLHYDEVPLVDALENMINQAGKGQWRLRMYAGSDQVLKPAHIEEPFGIALERILRIFNLKFEIFPGGKLIVITGADKFGFRGVE